MEKIFAILIILLNLFAISMIYKMLSGTETSYRIKVVILLAIITLVISYIVYGISAINVPSELKTVSKPLLLFTIYPINMIIMASPIAVLFNRVNSKEIEKEEFTKKITKMMIIFVIFIVVECIILKSIHSSLLNNVSRSISEKLS